VVGLEILVDIHHQKETMVVLDQDHRSEAVVAAELEPLAVLLLHQLVEQVEMEINLLLLAYQHIMLVVEEEEEKMLMVLVD
jgi:hypothetical protein